jgi:hypothetical protein
MLTLTLSIAILGLSACSQDSVLAPAATESLTQLGTQGSAPPVELPFEGSWDTTVTPPDPNTGVFQIYVVGRANYLGYNTGSGPSSVGPTGIQTGTTTYVAANGDQLFMEYTGPATPPDAEGNLSFSGTYTFVGGTGRFEDAGGTGTYAGTANLFAGVGQVSQTGTLILAPGARQPQIAD